MADITKCINEDCKNKDTCYRKLARDGAFQSTALFNKDNKKECEYYWEVK